MKSNYRLHVCYVCIQGVSWFCKSVFQWNVCNHTTGPGPIRLLSQCKSNTRNIHWPLWACSQEPLWGSRCSGSDWVAPSPPSHPLGPVAALEIRMTERSIQSLVFNNNNNNLKKSQSLAATCLAWAAAAPFCIRKLSENWQKYIYI